MAWQAKADCTLVRFCPHLSVVLVSCDRLFDGSSPTSGGLDLAGESDRDSPPGQAVERR
jgi:hypothetical protein